MMSRISKITFILMLALAAASCTKKEKTDAGAETGSGDSAISNTNMDADMADSDSGKAAGLQTVHYAYDSSTLDNDAKKTLDENARILKEKPNLKVQIEGHCDERGGIQYNIALGERRANAAKNYIIEKGGVDAGRLSIISYGKEKPIDSGHTEEAFSKNRRSNFRITEK